MPDGINGWELASQLMNRKPNLPVIYTSGYSPDILGRGMSENEDSFMTKPYTPPQLATMVRTFLDLQAKTS